jgi:hypothetical protein
MLSGLPVPLLVFLMLSRFDSRRFHRIQHTTVTRNSQALEEAFIEADSFVKSFLSALPNRYLKFRHKAPGIQLQTPIEFTNQPFADRRYNVFFPTLYHTDQETYSFPLLLFREEGENKPPWTRPWFPDGNLKAEKIPSGLYIESTEKDFNWVCGNRSRLFLPFRIGRNGFARSSIGIPFQYTSCAGTEWPGQIYH